MGKELERKRPGLPGRRTSDPSGSNISFWPKRRTKGNGEIDATDRQNGAANSQDGVTALSWIMKILSRAF